MKGQKKMKMIKFQLDVGFDYSLDYALENLARIMPDVWVRILQVEGPAGGGWPVIEFMMPEEKISEFVEKWYSGDQEIEIEAVPA
jgi:hypothetical protein